LYQSSTGSFSSGLRECSFCWVKQRKKKRAVAVPVLFLLFFSLPLAYHAVVTFLTAGLSMTNGWYLYCLVFAEMSLAGGALLAICSPCRDTDG